jgi:hypothetical protein
MVLVDEIGFDILLLNWKYWDGLEKVVLQKAIRPVHAFAQS